MKRYRVTAIVTVSCVTEIDAMNEKDARKIASGMSDHVYLAEQGAPGAYDWSDGFFVEEPDGEAHDFEFEEIEPEAVP